MTLISPLHDETLEELAIRCDALYEGPILVPYAGKDLKGRNYVGYKYFNFRKIEPHLKVVYRFAEAAYDKLDYNSLRLPLFETIIGIPNGGRTFAQALAHLADKKFAYAVNVPRPKIDGQKQEYDFDLSQFEFREGENVAVAEDVFNNFGNTDKNLEQIAATGANVVMLVGALDRSPHQRTHYTPKSGKYKGRRIPVITAISEAYPEYEQDDPVVFADMAAGNIEWEVKKNWARLREAMTVSPN